MASLITHHFSSQKQIQFVMETLVLWICMASLITHHFSSQKQIQFVLWIYGFMPSLASWLQDLTHAQVFPSIIVLLSFRCLDLACVQVLTFFPTFLPPFFLLPWPGTHPGLNFFTHPGLNFFLLLYFFISFCCLDLRSVQVLTFSPTFLPPFFLLPWPGTHPGLNFFLPTFLLSVAMTRHASRS